MNRPNISIFTPTHGDSAYLAEAWESIKAQDTDDWEWVVMVNNSTVTTLPVPEDPRIRFVYDRSGRVDGVGHAKRIAAAHCKGDILLELDHDDLLAPTALTEVREAFEQHPEASLVYSRFAQIQADGSPHPQQFDPAYGWEYDECNGFLVPRSLAPTPHNVSLIWYAPNHLRAIRRSAYRATRGYDPTLRVLDDLALMSELYRVGEFVSLDTLLYYQRIHGANTQLDLENNAKIQTGSWDLYEQNILLNYEAWCYRNKHRIARSPNQVGSHEENEYGLIWWGNQKWWIDNDMLSTAHRALVPNGMLSIFIPEGVPFNEHYFRAWCATSGAPFQASRIDTWVIGGQKWTQANLIAVKDGYTRDGGILHAK